jgi:interferon gamma-inducible protein 30
MYNDADFSGPAGIVNFGQSVWGNARQQGSVITCQHGATECKMNTLQNCAIALAGKNTSQWVSMVHCLETHGVNQQKFLTTCATAADYDLAALNTCWTGAQGKALDQAAFKATPSDHQYVPWVTVNGVNICTEAGCDTVLADVCAAYKGATKPAACGKLPAAPEAAPRADGAHTGCPVEW